MNKFIGFIQRLAFLFVFAALLIPHETASSLPATVPAAEIPLLDVFARQLYNGNPDELRGLHISNLLAARVVQQPPGDDQFISPRQNIITQYAPARRLGSIGLLAHNYLAGEHFSRLTAGQEIHLIYGDGRVAVYVASTFLRFQAAKPLDPDSTFIDLESHASLSAAELFSRAYARPGQVVFQTCIANGRDLSWGRLFIIAEPYSPG